MIKLKLNQLTESIHSTYQPDQYYIGLGAFPKDTVKQILDGSLEYENTRIDPEHNAYLSGEIQLGNTVYEYKIDVYQASDLDLTDGMEEEDTEDLDLEEVFMNNAGEALACVDSPHVLTVYLTEVNTVPLSVSDMEDSEIQRIDLDQEDLKGYMDGNEGYCIHCGEFTNGGCEPDAKEYECEACGNKTVFGAEQAFLEGYVKVK